MIGVTVHTGTADGGHYYSFIKERNGCQTGNGLTNLGYGGSREKWFLFNDAEVKQFDPAQIATECFGGEMTVFQFFLIKILSYSVRFLCIFSYIIEQNI